MFTSARHLTVKALMCKGVRKVKGVRM